MRIYGEEVSADVLRELTALLDRRRPHLSPRPGEISQRDSFLITYPDQIQQEGTAPLKVLADFCRAHFAGVLSGIHILPFNPWTSDDGFSVVDYRRVALEYGSWEDLTALAVDFRLMFDAVINHASVESAWFKAFKDGDPAYRDHFVVPPPGTDLSNVVRPRALPLLTPFQTARGMEEVWTTFSADQADLNYKNPQVLLEIVDVLLLYVERGADFLRMDAIAYLWKEPGTSCIHLPQTHALIQLFRAVLDEVAPHVSIITETNVPHAENISYFGDGTNEARLVYNFSLPPLVLYSFQTGSAETLSRWTETLKLPSSEVTFFNFLASHDGIGLNPLRGILTEREIEAIVKRYKDHGGLVSYKAEAGGKLLPYELNINYFDALNPPGTGELLKFQVDRFVTAHAILLAMTGVPGLYFHSLFGSRGWPEGAEATGRNRTINRQKFQRAEIESALADTALRQAQIFDRLSHLLRVRSDHPAFHPFGDQQVIRDNPAVFALLRTALDGSERVLCLQNVSGRKQPLPSGVLDAIQTQGPARDILSGRHVLNGEPILIQPCETLWLA